MYICASDSSESGIKCNPMQGFVEHKRNNVPFGLQKRNKFYLERDSKTLSQIGGNAWNKDSLQIIKPSLSA